MMRLSSLHKGTCPSGGVSFFTPRTRATAVTRPTLRRRTYACSTSTLNPASATQHYVRDPSPWPTAADCPLPTHNLDATNFVDLCVCGAGPAGVAVAERVAKAGFSVCIVDPVPLGPWPNNYGVWVDEFQAMGLEDCLEVIWPRAKVWLDNNAEGEKRLNRPYGRVDRPRLKRKLLEKCATNGVTFLYDKVSDVSHNGGTSSVSLASGRSISCSMVLDATGHSRKLVEYDKEFDPGYQGAYGIIAEVESHPFEVDTMLFMDWRDEHTAGDAAMRERNAALPTFLYAMPFSPTKIFLEETSLVARPALDFPDLKARLDARMAWLGIKVKHIEEEEYCLIPMGGVLPKHPQRVLALGGTAGMVHPSTGFMIARTLGTAPAVADAIVDALSLPADKATEAGSMRRPSSAAEAEEMSASVWRTLWPLQRVRQRAFFTMGMGMLIKLDLAQTRDFFAAFFSQSDYHWHGFLSARLSFWELISFGLSLFIHCNNAARLNLLSKGLPGLVGMLLDLVPTLGNYYNAPSLRERARQTLQPALASSGPPGTSAPKAPVVEPTLSLMAK